MMKLIKTKKYNKLRELENMLLYAKGRFVGTRHKKNQEEALHWRQRIRDLKDDIKKEKK